MISLFRRFFKKSDAGPTLGPDAPERMDLEERMAFRREMLYRAVRETMASIEVIAAMYKFKVSRVDERGHRYIVMVDVAKGFEVGTHAQVNGFADIEALVKKTAFDRYGVVVTGMYWRTNEDVNVFERKQRASDAHPAGATVRMARPAFDLPVTRSDPPSLGEDTVAELPRLSRGVYQPVAEDEALAFAAALKMGSRPPPIHVGNREYHSDVAPLMEDGIMIGGTQYGELR